MYALCSTRALVSYMENGWWRKEILDFVVFDFDKHLVLDPSFCTDETLPSYATWRPQEDLYKITNLVRL